MKKFFSSRMIQAEIIAGIFLIGATIMGIILQPWKTSESTVHAPQNIDKSPGAVQIQGDGNKVNQVATYAWANSDSWVTTLSRAPIPLSEAETEYNKVYLQFTASNSFLLPSRVCFKLNTKTQIIAIMPEGFSRGGIFNPKHPNYSYCFMGATRDQLIGVYSDQAFQLMEAELVGDI